MWVIFRYYSASAIWFESLFIYYTGVIWYRLYSDITEWVSFDLNHYLNITRAYFGVGYIKILRNKCHLIWITFRFYTSVFWSDSDSTQRVSFDLNHNLILHGYILVWTFRYYTTSGIWFVSYLDITHVRNASWVLIQILYGSHLGAAKHSNMSDSIPTSRICLDRQSQGNKHSYWYVHDTDCTVHVLSMTCTLRSRRSLCVAVAVLHFI